MPNARKLVIALDGPERSALAALAEHERRDLRAQAAILIRCELERRGLLAAEPMSPIPARAAKVQGDAAQ